MYTIMTASDAIDLPVLIVLRANQPGQVETDEYESQPYVRVPENVFEQRANRRYYQTFGMHAKLPVPTGMGIGHCRSPRYG
jgi:hypothetical protein